MDFINNVANGEPRALSVLLVLVILLFIVTKRYKKLPDDFKKMVSTLITVIGVLLILGLLANANAAVQFFNAIVDWVESLLRRFL